MALSALILALSMTAVQPYPAGPMAGAPPADPGAKYCMRVEAITGSRIETVECWTRAEWADQGVDVDLDWAREGVAVTA